MPSPGPERHIFENLTPTQIERATAQAFPLWSGRAPFARGNLPEDIPTLYPILPDPSLHTGAAIIVCPGGGYNILAGHEAVPVAEWLADLGITGFVLQYRKLPYVHPIPLIDAQRAIRTVRSRAVEFDIDPNRVGILGFSAGGHLASASATLFDEGDPTAEDTIEHQSARPDAAVLIYPVTLLTLSTGKQTHNFASNVLGESNARDPKLINQLSTCKQVSSLTPPTFLWHCIGDTVVPYEHSQRFAQACQENNVPFELHLIGYGKHGFGTKAEYSKLLAWMDICANWLCVMGFSHDITTQNHGGAV